VALMAVADKHGGAGPRRHHRAAGGGVAVHMIKLTMQREITPYFRSHSDG
jgi:hypothetical protein